MFRINLYLNFYNFLKSFFLLKTRSELKNYITSEILSQTKKKNVIFSSQCRVAFLYVLKFLKLNYPKKKEIIFFSYNLPEMINVAKNLNYKIKFCDLDLKTGQINFNSLKKIVTKKTSAIVLTNMFNNYKYSKKIKSFSARKKITLIEDNAIYFDNFTKFGKKKIFSGSLGDFSIYSFNIMKNISALYGGALATNNKLFVDFYKKNSENHKSFFKSYLIKQIVIYLILKVMSIRILFKTIFLHIIKLTHQYKIHSILKLFYPSLKFKIINFPKYYFTSISNMSLKLIYLQLKDKNRRNELFQKRKDKNNYYQRQLSRIKNKRLKLIKIKDFNYQNYIDYPILVNDKKKMNMFLLKKGIEIRYIYYKNCEAIFSKRKNLCKNSKFFEDKLICLPNHQNITFNYIDKVIKNINLFLKQNENKN